MKRNKLDLADAVFKAAHGTPPLSTCPLCLGCGKCEPQLAHLASEAIARARESVARRTPPRARAPARDARLPTASVRLPPLDQGPAPAPEPAPAPAPAPVPARPSDSWPQQALKNINSSTSLPPIKKSTSTPKNCTFFIDFSNMDESLSDGGGDGDHAHAPAPAPALPPIPGTATPASRSVTRSVTRPAPAPAPAPATTSASACASTGHSERCTSKDVASNPSTSYDSEPLSHGAAIELYRYAMVNIGTSKWDDVIDGLTSMSRVLKCAPHLVADSGQLPNLMRSVNALVRSLRSKVAICACRTAYALFKRVDCSRRPAFDQLVGSLLTRTGDMNKFLRQEALRALTAMAEYIPLLNAVRALIEQGGRNKNDLVRAATAQMLDLVVECRGPGALLDKREIREKLCPVMAALLEDPHPDTRAFAKQTFATLCLDERFRGYFKALIRPNQLLRLERTIAAIH